METFDDYNIANALTCPCGSGKMCEAQYDVRNIYLCRTCPDCHEVKMRQYRPGVLAHTNFLHDEPL